MTENGTHLGLKFKHMGEKRNINSLMAINAFYGTKMIEWVQKCFKTYKTPCKFNS